MRPLLALQTLLKRVQIIVTTYYECFVTAESYSYLCNMMTMSSRPSLSSILAIEPNQSLLNQLNDVYTAVDARLHQSPELAQICRDLHSRTVKVVKFAKLYDFNDETEANGYWTYVRLIIKFGKYILNTDIRGKDFKNDFIPVSQVLRTGLDLCERFRSESLGSIEQIDDGITSDPSDKFKPQLFASTPEQFVNLLEIFKSLTPQLDVVYGSYCSFWLCTSMRRAMQGFTTLMAMYSCNSASFGSLWQSSKNLWDRSHRAHTVAHIAQNATVEFVKSFWGLAELNIIKNGLSSFAVRAQPKVIKDVYIPRQNRWKISGSSPQVFEMNQLSGEQSAKSIDLKVRCRLLQSEVPSTKNLDSIVLHIHGGGFVSQSPDSHECYLREWATKLEGIPILSVDYSLSPEAKYPIALQEVLDCYLWLTSKDTSVEEMIGFHPTKIVVCGDSAGGNLSCALSLVLNDIRKSINNKSVGEVKHDFQVPAGVLCFYTPFMLMTVPSPSRLMTAVDTLLPLGVLLACLEAYAPSDSNLAVETQSSKQSANSIQIPQSNTALMSPSSGVSEGESEHDENQSFDFASLHFLNSDYDCERLSASEEEEEVESTKIDDNDHEVGNDFVHITYDDVPPDEDLLFELPNDLSFKWQRKCCHTLRKIKDKIIGPSQPSVFDSTPWYRQSPALLDAKLKQLNSSTNNPYISPLLTQQFDFDDIPLYLVALTYDACLDDSVEMAKKWKGPVVLDVLDELPHGFLNFVLLSEEGRRASQLCLNRIKQALGVE